MFSQGLRQVPNTKYSLFLMNRLHDLDYSFSLEIISRVLITYSSYKQKVKLDGSTLKLAPFFHLCTKRTDSLSTLLVERLLVINSSHSRTGCRNQMKFLLEKGQVKVCTLFPAEVKFDIETRHSTSKPLLDTNIINPKIALGKKNQNDSFNIE